MAEPFRAGTPSRIIFGEISTEFGIAARWAKKLEAQSMLSNAESAEEARASPRSRGWDLDPPDQALARCAGPQRERCASGGGRRFRVPTVGRRPPPDVTGLV